MATESSKGIQAKKLSGRSVKLCLSARMPTSKVVCCGTFEETVSKVPQVTPDQEEPSSDDTESISTTDRPCTDIIALLVLILLIGGFSFLLVIAVKKGDVYRVINGYDDCANVCGRETPPEWDPLFDCERVDKTDFPYLLINADSNGVKSRQCVVNCTSSQDHIVFLNRCVPKNITDSVNSVIKFLGLQSFFYEVSHDLSIAWRELIYLFSIALAISLGILIAFLYVVEWVIYGILTSAVVAPIGGTIYLWLALWQEKEAVSSGVLHEEDASVTSYMTYAIIMSVVDVVVVLVVLVMRKRIALVVQLFREAGRALYAMPALLLQPIYTYLFIGLSFVAWLCFLLTIESAGDLYRNEKGHYHYEKDAILITARWYNFFMFFLMCEFLLGCQHMVVAGSVARWYFTRDGKSVSMPVARSTYTVVRFHLGTVAFGAMVIELVRFLRAILTFIHAPLKSLDNDFAKRILGCCHRCFWWFEAALEFLTRNAYIETAIYGCNFWAGGRQAVHVLSSHFLRIATINSVGDFVLFLGKVLVVASTGVSGVYLIQAKRELHHPWVPITLSGIIAFLVAHCFISIYEMIIDTIFICFCEDCARNDGKTRPYFVSLEFLEFMENCEKALGPLEKKETPHPKQSSNE